VRKGNVYRLMNEFRLEEHKVRHDQVRTAAGHPSKKRPDARQRAREKRIQSLFENFERTRDVEKFLRGLSLNVGDVLDNDVVDADEEDEDEEIE